MNKLIIAAIFSIAIVLSAVVLGNAVKNRNKKEGTISVTGLGKTDFTSDLIVWDGRFERESENLQQAYSDLKNDRELVSEYLISKGIKKEDLIFNAVSTRKNTRPKYGENGNYMGDDFLGYVLVQQVQINSKEVEKVEKVSREVTELLNKGVRFYSEDPRYYYTKLEDLKIEMIAQATANARLRAEQIAERSGAEFGDLIDANMGIFQITGQYSGEDYSWGGTYNVSSKDKTTTITMKLTYRVN